MSSIILTIGMANALHFFINIPSIVIVLWLGSAMGVLSYGLRPFLRALRDVRLLLLVVAQSDLSDDSPRVLRGLAVQLYAAGIIGMLIGLVQLLATLDDFNKLPIGFAVCLLTIFYAAVLAEGVLRPAIRRMEFLREQGA
jgi:type III secretory pathway component EscS